MIRLAVVLIASLIAGSSTLDAQRATRPPVVSTAVVNLNTASAMQIAELPGIGVKTAELIVQYREKNGPFKKIEELMNVRGVGEKNFHKLKDQVSVGNAKADHDQPPQR